MKSKLNFATFSMPQGQNPRMIVTPIEVLKPGAAAPGSLVKLSLMAQWDSGADYCMISPRIASALRLKSFGNASVNVVGDTQSSRAAYMVDLALPNGIFFSEVLAIEDEGLEATGIDFLVGLAVINELDFALTHDKSGNSVLSISFPPERLVDFCANNSGKKLY